MVHPYPTLQSRRFFDPFVDGLAREQLDSSTVAVDWRVTQLQHFIDTEHGKLGWNLGRVCEHLDLGVSASRARKLFKEHLGVGVREYTKRRRLVVAAEKLKTTTFSVKEIAADLGYKDQTAFWRQFKQLFSLNPTQFRSAHHQGGGQNTQRFEPQR